MKALEVIDREANNVDVPGFIAVQLSEARQDLADLIAAAKNLRAYVDVSTIRPGKLVELGWTGRLEAFDNALAKVEGNK